MNNNLLTFESIGQSIVGQIYPYIVNDLKTYYKESFSNKNILEIGTGPGFILIQLLKENFTHIYGIDISLDMLIKASNRIQNTEKLSLINAKAENLPFKNESIDIILSRGSVFFWKDIEKALFEIYRVLKPKGFLLIGGGYGISTPENLIMDISNYLKKNISKNEKPKIEINNVTNIMKKIGGKFEVISKPKHGFWVSWRKN